MVCIFVTLTPGYLLQGDSGGPLVCERNGTWYQVGIASFTARNTPEDFPGVFTRVSSYTDWVYNTIARN